MNRIYRTVTLLYWGLAWVGGQCAGRRPTPPAHCCCGGASGAARRRMDPLRNLRINPEFV